MAKKVVFESERYEKRQSIRRLLFPAAGILVLAAIAVVITLLLRGRTAVLSGGGDTPYPYTWTVNKDGTATLELDRSAAPGYVWRQDGSAPAVSVAPAAGQAGQDRFLLTPEGQGRFMLTFSLRNPEDESDRIYELTFLSEAEEQKGQLRAVPASVVGKAIQGTVRGGGETEFPYTIQTDGDGDLTITVLLPEEPEEPEDSTELREDEEPAGEEEEGPTSDWQCSSGDEGVALPLGIIYTDTEVVCYFRPGPEAGTVTLRVTEAISGVCVTAECENAPEGSLQVLSHSVSLG